jgi:hypothetical protein
VLLIRRIRDLLYDQGFTISGARNRLADSLGVAQPALAADADNLEADVQPDVAAALDAAPLLDLPSHDIDGAAPGPSAIAQRMLRAELLSIRELLKPEPAGS